MSDLIYVGFVLAGAVTLVIEAYRNFNAPNARHPFELHPILKEVEVRNLCTTNEIAAGFVFYALLYLVAYAIILSSAEVYGLLARANSALGEIGAADGTVSVSDAAVSDILSSASGDYSKPIIVSALIISSLSIGAVKPIEITMRSLAHRLSGVPRGVYRVIEHIRNAKFDELMRGHSTPLTNKFEKNASRSNAFSSDDVGVNSVVMALKAIDCLSIVADTTRLATYFPLRNLERLKPLIDKVGASIRGLDETIERLLVPKSRATDNAVDIAPAGSGEEPADKAGDNGENRKRAEHRAILEELQVKANATLSDVIAVFAVLYIRNDHAVFSQSINKKVADNPIDKLKATIAVSEKFEHNAFGASIFLAFVLSYFLAVAGYYKWLYWAAVSGDAAYRAAGAELQPMLSGCNTTFSLACETAVLQWRQTQISDIFAAAAWDQLQAVLVTFFCVLLVIVGREVRVEQQSWQDDWRFTQFPFLKLLAMSVLSAVVAVFLTALVQLTKFWWEAGFEITRPQMIGLFREGGRYLILQAFGGLILGLSALVIMDKHGKVMDKRRKGSMRFTLTLATLGGLVYLFFQWASLIISVGYVRGPVAAYVSQTVRDALMYSFHPILFLLIFAYLLELSETDDDAATKTTQGNKGSQKSGGETERSAAEA